MRFFLPRLQMVVAIALFTLAGSALGAAPKVHTVTLGSARINGDPGSGLPYPVRSRVTWQRIVDVQCAPNRERAFGDLIA